MNKLIITELVFEKFNPDTPGQVDKYLVSADLNLEYGDAAEPADDIVSLDIKKIRDDISLFLNMNRNKSVDITARHLASHILLNFSYIDNLTLTFTDPRAAAFQITRGWHTSYLGAGSNLGDRSFNIRKGIDFINKSEFSHVTKISKIYETEPFGYEEQDLFLNCVLEIKTLLSPRNLIRFLLGVEKELKRERIIPMGPRTLDLDILFYDDLVTAFEEAVIPHPRLHERMFVMKPLCDIAPYHIHPLLKERCYRIADNLLPDQQEPVEWNGTLPW